MPIEKAKKKSILYSGIFFGAKTVKNIYINRKLLKSYEEICIQIKNPTGGKKFFDVFMSQKMSPMGDKTLVKKGLIIYMIVMLDVIIINFNIIQ